jgi:hypothetical protein
MKTVTSSTIEIVFSVGSVQSAGKSIECRSKFSSGQLGVSPEEFLVARFQSD